MTRLIHHYPIHRFTAASIPTDWQEELPKENWDEIMKYFEYLPKRNDNGIAAASRKMNIRWRPMNRQTIFYMALQVMMCLDCSSLTFFPDKSSSALPEDM